MESIVATPSTQRTKTYLYLLFAICFTGGVFGGITSTLMSAYLPIVVKDVMGNSSQRVIDEVSSIINSLYLFGMMFGGLMMGLASDRYGRKIAVQLSMGFLGAFTLLTAFAPGWWLIVLCRFFTGFGVGGILVTATILVAEEWTKKNRNVALGILSITIPVGIFSAGIITYYILEWRTGFLIGIIPLMLAIVAQFIIHESAQWKKSCVTDGVMKEKRISIFDPSIVYDLLIGCIIYGTMLIGLWAVFAWLPTCVQTLIHTSDGHKERGISMMLFAVGGLSGGFISGWISNAIGIKKTMLLCFAGAFFLSFILFKLNASLTFFSYLEMAFIALFFGISQGALNFYIPELFPISIRSSATGFCFNIGRLFTASVVFFVGWLVHVLGGYGNALFTFSFIFLIGLMATFFAKEKKLIR